MPSWRSHRTNFAANTKFNVYCLLTHQKLGTVSAMNERHALVRAQIRWSRASIGVADQYKRTAKGLMYDDRRW